MLYMTVYLLSEVSSDDTQFGTFLKLKASVDWNLHLSILHTTKEGLNL